MASYYWIKLWLDLLDDMKVAVLPDRLWRRMIECFLLAREWDRGGELPPLNRIAWRLRISEDALVADLRALGEATQAGGRCVVEERDGSWFVVQFSKRQAPMTDAQRKRKERRRDRGVTAARPAGVTSGSRNVTTEDRGQTTEEQRNRQQTTDMDVVAVLRSFGMDRAEVVAAAALDAGLTVEEIMTLVQYAEVKGLGPGWVYNRCQSGEAIRGWMNEPEDRRRYMGGEYADYIQH